MDHIQERSENGDAKNNTDTDKGDIAVNVDESVSIVGDIDKAEREKAEDERDTQDLISRIQQLNLDDNDSPVEIETVHSPEDACVEEADSVRSEHKVIVSNTSLEKREFPKDEDIVCSPATTNNGHIDTNPDEENSIDTPLTPSLPTKPKPEPKDRKLLKRARISEKDFVVDSALVKEVAKEILELNETIVPEKQEMPQKGVKPPPKDPRSRAESCLQRARRIYGRGYRPRGLTTKPANLHPKRPNGD